MKLTNKALTAINTPRIRVKLADTLCFTEAWIIRLIERNKDNSPLTTAAALRIIQQQTGLEESQILKEAVAEL